MSAFASFARARWGRTLAATVAAGAVLTAAPPTAQAAEVLSATFSGGEKTYTAADGTVYAKAGARLTLTVVTDDKTKCVRVAAPGYSEVRTTGQSPWTFPVTAGVGEGSETFTIVAGNGNNGNNCNGQLDQDTEAYIKDNAAPVLSGVSTPAPNAAGWNDGDVTVTWSAADAGSGVASGPTPASSSVTANTGKDGQVLTAIATDHVGNSASASHVVKVDTDGPVVSVSQSPAANEHGWNNTDVTVSFQCTDALSGLAQCSEPTTLSASGTATGTTADVAGNTTTASKSVNIDKQAPTLSGVPVTQPNGDNGWYTDDVRIDWRADDALSGLAAPVPGSSTITGEGTGLTVTESVSDKAGNTTTAASAPSVKIDRTAPVSAISAPQGWNSSAATVELSADDNLSGVELTKYSVDGGSETTYTGPFTLGEGDHTVKYWSVDQAGNPERARTASVRVDSTVPSISYVLSQLANLNGWHNADVTVDFRCDDNLSGITSCGPDVTVSEEGEGQHVDGTAQDAAGNTADTAATVNLDKTAPSIEARADRIPDRNGWYNRDVTVSFTCDDKLSGIGVLKGGTDCPAAVLLGEGSDQGAKGSVVDAAGNNAAHGVTGINVDKTKPVLVGTASHTGWVNRDVTVSWTCSDALSGIDGDCPADSVVTGEGDNLSVSSSVSDVAGNTADATVSDIKIDRTAPQTNVDVLAPTRSGWYGGAVRVHLTGVDPLSGVATTYYSVDGKAPQPYAGAFDFVEGGEHTLTFWSVDRAGNVEDRNSPEQQIVLKIDDVEPSIVGSRTPAGNAHGWINLPVQVSFECTDAHSGVAECSGARQVASEGAGQSVTGHVTDNVGHSGSVTVRDINIDLTAPALRAVATSEPNAAGWYKGDVVIEWQGHDALSGIDPTTQPENTTITDEGDNLGAGPVTITDKAGNVSEPATVNGIKIDRTDPKLSGAATTKPNAAGWYNDDVVIDWTATDSLSGIALGDAPGDTVVTDEGAELSVTASVTDVAGNADSSTVSGIKIDRTAPKTTVELSELPESGWYRGDVPVTLDATDALSQVATTFYAVDGGEAQEYTGRFSFDLRGSHSLAVWSVDNAGNVEARKSVDIDIDDEKPSIEVTSRTPANANGWNNGPVSVTFECDDLFSKVLGDCGPAVTVSTEGRAQSVTGKVHDHAGNTNEMTVQDINIDLTLPTVRDGGPTAAPNGSNGWYTAAVTNTFTAWDDLSGLSPSQPVSWTSSSGDQEGSEITLHSGHVNDLADNSAAVSSRSFKVDLSDPTHVTFNGGPADGTTYTTLNVPSQPTCAAEDAVSGLESCVVTGYSNTPGTHTVTATATDNAGRTAVATRTYTVKRPYTTKGFYAPVDMGGVLNTVKGGSTVPMKFEVFDGTTELTSTSVVEAVTVRQTNCTANATVDAVETLASSGTGLRYDSVSGQYHYNWQTPKTVGVCYTTKVTLTDGSTISALFKTK